MDVCNNIQEAFRIHAHVRLDGLNTLALDRLISMSRLFHVHEGCKVEDMICITW